jgi:hypothetical protein
MCGFLARICRGSALVRGKPLPLPLPPLPLPLPLPRGTSKRRPLTKKLFQTFTAFAFINVSFLGVTP